MRSRITMAKINNVWYGEFYSPVNSCRIEDRESFYAYAAEAIEEMRSKDRNIPMVLIGDFNAHLKDHYGTSTNGNGRLLLDIANNQSLELINMNHPTFERPGRDPTCLDYLLLNKKGNEALLKASVREEIYTTSDHHLIEITMNASLLLLTEQPQLRPRRIAVKKLKQNKRRELYQELLKEQWNKLKDVTFNDPDR